MKNDFKKMINGAMEIRREYDKVEPKKWEVEQVFMGFMKDVGELSKVLMVKKGFRNDFEKDVNNSLGHQLADILLSIIWIAEKEGINLEESFWKTVNALQDKLKNNS